jgi:hypothetical protein
MTPIFLTCPGTRIGNLLSFSVKMPMERENFPSFYELSEIDQPYLEYYSGWDTGYLQPKFNWCYFAEITLTNYHPFRPSIIVKDWKGKEHPIIFYLDDVPGLSNPFFPGEQFKVGQTICLLYAERKTFMDLSEGIRKEDSDFYIFKCALDQLIKVASMIQSRAGCLSCGKDNIKLLQCGKCKLAAYCGKECQKTDWKVHKNICPDMPMLKKLMELLKSRFEEFCSFQRLNLQICLNKRAFS